MNTNPISYYDYVITNVNYKFGDNSKSPIEEVKIWERKKLLNTLALLSGNKLLEPNITFVNPVIKTRSDIVKMLNAGEKITTYIIKEKGSLGQMLLPISMLANEINIEKNTNNLFPPVILDPQHQYKYIKTQSDSITEDNLNHLPYIV